MKAAGIRVRFFSVTSASATDPSFFGRHRLAGREGCSKAVAHLHRLLQSSETETETGREMKDSRARVARFPSEFVPLLAEHAGTLSTHEQLVAISALKQMPPGDPKALHVPVIRRGSRTSSSSSSPAHSTVSLLDLLLDHLTASLYHVSTPQELVDAGETLAALEIRHEGFLTEFVRKAGGLVTRKKLNALLLARVLHVAALFRLNPNVPAVEAFLRAVSFRLAEGPTGGGGRLAALPAPFFVQAARDCARLGWDHGPLLTVIGACARLEIERLSASYGNDIGGRKKGKDWEPEAGLRAEDWIDLVGSVGSLGLEFHMMNTFCADNLVKEVPRMSLRLMRLCMCNFASCGSYPETLMATLFEYLPSALRNEAEREREREKRKKKESLHYRDLEVPQKGRRGRRSRANLPAGSASVSPLSTTAVFKFQSSSAAVDAVKILNALGRVRARPRGVLSAVLSVLEEQWQEGGEDSRGAVLRGENAKGYWGNEEEGKEEMGDQGRETNALSMAVQVLYELHRLDLWHENVAMACMQIISESVRDGAVNALDPKSCANLLLAWTFFSIAPADLFSEVLSQLLRRESSLEPVSVSQLKVVELAIRVGHLPFDLHDVEEHLQAFLARVRTAELPPEEVGTSAMQRQVGGASRDVEFSLYSEVCIGPYRLDFVRKEEALSPSELGVNLDSGLHFGEEGDGENGGEEEEEDGEQTGEEGAKWLRLAQTGLVVEVDGPQHFYRGTRHWVASSKLKHQLLEGLGLTVLHVPWFDWQKLNSHAQRRAYMLRLLQRGQEERQRREEAFLSEVAEAYGEAAAAAKKEQVRNVQSE
uniref:RAP domain-containing protein n=1 Tax=Chromera velia CCMP2878 TaxID=1169474 RepID=A0A0G4HGK5_9ALVE|eukprot:Cvel_6722.t1-p1 / transcript=Cvel_6722.t1 / gene=Cvel_6722 / organism=Chromera_velia_CCMP2878 / gene_product=hypothetical protein / transcript_product=hypothetical protein / location=Cvel_scaffold336:14337-21992(-) / protein_length=819 / sequence_SO=supercontig / SO=protein_coding / is_pseudo=false